MPGLKFSRITKLNQKSSFTKKKKNNIALTSNSEVKGVLSIKRKKSYENRTKNF